MKAFPIAAGLLLALAGCALGPKAPQVTGTPSAPISADVVKLYAPKCMPAGYEKVAALDASKLGINSSYEFNLRWIQQLREQAAGLGANGLEVIPLNHAATIGPTRHGPAFAVLAIREPPQAAPATGTSMWAESCAHVAKLLRYEVLHGQAPGMAGNGNPSD